MAGVRDRPRPLDLPGRPQPGEQTFVQPLPHPGPLPLIHPPVTSRARHRSRARPANDATRSPCAAQTGPPAAPAGQATAYDPDSGTAARPSEAAARIRNHNSSDTIHGAATIGTPSLTTGSDRI